MRSSLNRLVFLLLLLGILLAATATTGVNGQTGLQTGEPQVTVVNVYWGTSLASPVEAAPGDRNLPFSVEVQNTGTRDITFIDASLSLNGTPFTNVLGKSNALASGPIVLRVGYRGTLRFDLNTVEGAPLGLHPAQMYLYYWNLTGQRVVLAVNVAIPLLGRVALRISSSTLFVYPGSDSLRLALSSEGSGRADGVQAVLTLPPPLLPLEGKTGWSLGSIEAGGSASLNPLVYVPQSAAGASYRFTVTVAYMDAYGSARRTEGSFDLVVQRAQVTSTDLSFNVDPRTGPAGVTRRISGRLVRLDTGAGIVGASIALELIDPRMRAETYNYTTGVQGYWEAEYVPAEDGDYSVTAWFEGGPSGLDPSLMYGPSRVTATLTATPAVSVTSPEPWQVTVPGSRLTYSLQIANQGLRDDRFLLDLSGLPSDFEGKFYSGSIEVKAVELQAGASKELKLTVTPPETAAAGTYRFRLEAKGEFSGAFYDLALGIEAVPRGLKLESPLTSLTVATGESLAYPINVINLGAQREQVFLYMNTTAELLDWRGSFTADGRTIDNLVLDADQSAWVIFKAQPPYLVKVGEYRLIVYAATADGLYHDTLDLNGEVQGSYRLETGVQPLHPIVYTGDKAEIMVTVYNRGLSPVTGLSLNVATPPFLNLTVVPLNVISLAPGQDQAFLVRVTAPATATTGEYVLSFTAVSQEASSNLNSISISVQSPIPWYWISIGLAAVGAGFAALALERLLWRLQLKARREQTTSS